jgi:Helicase conserved C-terminal domain
MAQIETMIKNAVGHALEQFSGQVTNRMQESLSEILHHRLPFLPSSQAPALSTSTGIAVHPSRINILRALYPQHSSHQFRSPQQAELLEAVLQGEHHVFGILATGGGKSIAIYGPPLIESSGISVCIVPFVSLEEEQLRTAEAFNIPVSAWPNRKMDVHTIRLVIVPAHRAGTSEFLQWLEAMTECKLLRRITVDETHHLVIDQPYRYSYEIFDRFVKLGVSINFLSGTLLPWTVPAIAAKMRIPMSLTREIRGPTYRPNLRYSVRKLDTKQQLYEQVHELYNSYSKTLEDDERMIIFCSTYRDADALAELTNLPIYRGHMEKDISTAENAARKREVARLWRSGQPKALIATSAFGEGIDYPHVRCVISCEPRNLLSSAQELGRGGRDGKRSEAITLYTTIPTVSSVDGVDHSGVLPLINFLQLDRCHRWSQGVLDNSAHTCAAIPGAIPCGVCVTEAVSASLLILFYTLTFVQLVQDPARYTTYPPCPTGCASSSDPPTGDPTYTPERIPPP